MGEHGCMDLVIWQIRLFDHVYWFYIHVSVNGWFFWKSLACPAKDVVWKWKVLPATSHRWNCLSNDNVIRRFFEKEFPPSSLIPQISSCCLLIFPAEIAVVCNSANSLDLFSLPKKKTVKASAYFWLLYFTSKGSRPATHLGREPNPEFESLWASGRGLVHAGSAISCEIRNISVVIFALFSTTNINMTDMLNFTPDCQMFIPHPFFSLLISAHAYEYVSDNWPPLCILCNRFFLTFL